MYVCVYCRRSLQNTTDAIPVVLVMVENNQWEWAYNIEHVTSSEWRTMIMLYSKAEVDFMYGAEYAWWSWKDPLFSISEQRVIGTAKVPDDDWQTRVAQQNRREINHEASVLHLLPMVRTDDYQRSCSATAGTRKTLLFFRTQLEGRDTVIYCLLRPVQNSPDN